MIGKTNGIINRPRKYVTGAMNGSNTKVMTISGLTFTPVNVVIMAARARTAAYNSLDIASAGIIDGEQYIGCWAYYPSASEGIWGTTLKTDIAYNAGILTITVTSTLAIKFNSSYSYRYIITD